MVRLKSRYLVISLTFKDGKLFHPSAKLGSPLDSSSSTSSSSSSSSSLLLLEPASEAALLPPLRAALSASAGDLGAAAAGPGGGLSVRAFDPTSGVAVVRCPRSSVGALRVAMATAMPSVANRSLRGGGASTLRVCGSAGSARRAAAKAVRSRPLLGCLSSVRPLVSRSKTTAFAGEKKQSKKKGKIDTSSRSSDNKGDRLRAAVSRVREEALRRIASFDA